MRGVGEEEASVRREIEVSVQVTVQSKSRLGSKQKEKTSDVV